MEQELYILEINIPTAKDQVKTQTHTFKNIDSARKYYNLLKDLNKNRKGKYSIILKRVYHVEDVIENYTKED